MLLNWSTCDRTAVGTLEVGVVSKRYVKLNIIGIAILVVYENECSILECLFITIEHTLIIVDVLTLIAKCVCTWQEVAC